MDDFWNTDSDSEYTKGIGRLTELISTGDYSIGEIKATTINPNTRFVLVEKYPEKSKHKFSKDGICTTMMYLDIELIRTVKSIQTTIRIDKPNESE
jgi:hypothetical protein